MPNELRSTWTDFRFVEEDNQICISIVGTVGGGTPTKIITTVPKGGGQTPSSQTQFIVVTTRPGGVAQAGNTYTTVRCKDSN